ncbi:XRE family transcriptional regulator [Kitasatospora sp. NA04385]|uniref:Scr1 family TA system antitoxin-like transcriptional regulator n=1 Tax=Kitasatospora sp. NA04385 TaxID=2742135 RepID=UPI00158FBBC3|nr:Scr1 family TA system antitoxin-like transcriptional regulator [Kitasatospora sp. NA04385]QKW22648.1 XRE family transcriptional regulator [Kitasatospora sp. NA04385]
MGRSMMPPSPTTPVGRFACDLQSLKQRSGLTLAAISERCGLSVPTLSRAFSGRNLPSRYTLQGIVEVCGGDVRSWHQRLERCEIEALGPSSEDELLLRALRSWTPSRSWVPLDKVWDLDEYRTWLRVAKRYSGRSFQKLAHLSALGQRSWSAESFAALLTGRRRMNPHCVLSFLTACGISRRTDLVSWLWAMPSKGNQRLAMEVMAAHTSLVTGGQGERERGARAAGAAGYGEGPTHRNSANGALESLLGTVLKQLRRDEAVVNTPHGLMVVPVGGAPATIPPVRETPSGGPNPVNTTGADNLAHQAGYIPLEPYPGNAVARWRCMCTYCGTETSASLRQLQARKKCWSCGMPSGGSTAPLTDQDGGDHLPGGQTTHTREHANVESHPGQPRTGTKPGGTGESTGSGGARSESVSSKKPVDPSGSWAVPALLLGAKLRSARGASTLAGILTKARPRMSLSLYSRIESGEQRIDNPAVVGVLLDALGVRSGPQRRQFLQLAHDASVKGWADSLSSRELGAAAPATIRRLTSLEERAQQQFVIDTTVIPEVLQSRRYREVITRRTLPASQQHLADRTIEVRRMRADRFKAGKQRSVFFVRSSALYANFGAPEMMVEQLSLLLQHVENEKSPVGIRVMETERPLALSVNSLTRFSFEQGPVAVPDVIYVEAGKHTSFERGPVPGEEQDSCYLDYFDYTDIIDDVVLRAPGWARSRELITEALEWHRARS